MAIHQKLVLTQRLEDIEMSEMRPSHVSGKSIEECEFRSNHSYSGRSEKGSEEDFWVQPGQSRRVRL